MARQIKKSSFCFKNNHHDPFWKKKVGRIAKRGDGEPKSTHTSRAQNADSEWTTVPLLGTQRLQGLTSARPGRGPRGLSAGGWPAHLSFQRGICPLQPGRLPRRCGSGAQTSLTEMRLATPHPLPTPLRPSRGPHFPGTFQPPASPTVQTGTESLRVITTLYSAPSAVC